MSELALFGGPPVRGEPYPEWPQFDASDVETVAEVVRSGRWGRLGHELVVAFEKEFAAYQGAAHCVTLNSGTSALEIALQALRLPRGSEVVLAPYTYMASAAAILNAGLVPVFVDVDPETYNIDPDLIEAAVTPRTSALMAVHFGGLSCDMAPILEIARRHSLRVIEDAAHAHGGRWKDRGLGVVGDIGCFSFQATKNLSAGEGGAILTNDVDLYRAAIDYHDLLAGGMLLRGGELGLGSSRAGPGWDFPFAGSSRRLTVFQAALLRRQLERLERQTECRAANADYLTGLLEDIEGLTPRREDGFATRNAHHLYIIRYGSESFGGLPRDRFIEAMEAEGVPLAAGYRTPLHRTGLFLNHDGELARAWPRNGGIPDLDYTRVACPNAERLCSGETLWLGQNILLDSHEGMDQIVEAAEKVRAGAQELASTAG